MKKQIKVSVIVRNLGDGNTLTQKTDQKESAYLWYGTMNTIIEYEYNKSPLVISKCKYVTTTENLSLKVYREMSYRGRFGSHQ